MIFETFLMQVPKTCQTQVLTGHILLEHHPRNLFERAFQISNDVFSHVFLPSWSTNVMFPSWLYNNSSRKALSAASPISFQVRFQLSAVGGIVGMKKWRDITRYSYITSWFLDLKKDSGPLDWENDDQKMRKDLFFAETWRHQLDDVPSNKHS